MSLRKSTKDEANKDIVKIIHTPGKGAKSCISKFLGDVSKESAAKQIILGGSSGCITGILATRIGKVIALAVGGSIIILQIANEQGYIHINWSKVNRKVDKIVDKVEEKVTGEGPSWVDKAERFVDRKIDKVEDIIKTKQVKAKRWYSSLIGDSKCQLQEIHVFLVSFIAGVAIGIAAS